MGEQRVPKVSHTRGYPIWQVAPQRRPSAASLFCLYSSGLVFAPRASGSLLHRLKLIYKVCDSPDPSDSILTRLYILVSPSGATDPCRL